MSVNIPDDTIERVQNIERLCDRIIGLIGLIDRTEIIGQGTKSVCAITTHIRQNTSGCGCYRCITSGQSVH